MQGVRVDADDIPPTDVDGDKMQQVVSNLIVTAFKYTPEDGEILLRVDAHDGLARLRVIQSGIGIPHELRSRIFEGFSDVNAVKHHTSFGPDSAGLGLRIARGLVELHGGTIHIDSGALWLLLPFAGEG
jgi:signal transduction histidine kinase